jgi:hypothetical protein
VAGNVVVTAEVDGKQHNNLWLAMLLWLVKLVFPVVTVVVTIVMCRSTTLITAANSITYNTKYCVILLIILSNVN